MSSSLCVVVHRGSELSTDCRRKLGRYRHDVFIKELGWSLPDKCEDAEWDRYDTDTTTHVVLQDQKGDVHGCTRLIPTRGGAYMLSELFSHLMPDDIPLPDSNQVWELSRLAISVARVPSVDDGQNYLQRTLLTALLAKAANHALLHGVQRLIGLTYVGVERLLRRLGVHIHRAGPAVEVDGRMVVAGWIELDEQTMRALSADSSVCGSHRGFRRNKAFGYAVDSEASDGSDEGTPEWGGGKSAQAPALTTHWT
ncbi:acyl homoserine lactone synthase [Paraburkholderia sp. BL6665CI2N2]|nr:acyl homoserine lactone synthase [Paraburkholderia sp. BL6665CI2N2]